MTRRHADYYPARASAYVPLMDYHAEVDGTDSTYKADIGVLIAAVPDGILALASIATATTLSTFAATYSQNAMGRYGRNVTLVASGAATGNVVVRGLDYLSQPMSETLALNGATTVQGKKAFKQIQQVVVPAVAATTISLGWGNVLGLPFSTTNLTAVLVDGVAPAAGTFVPGNVTSQTATSNDPRGTYTPAAGAVPNAARKIEILAYATEGNLLGPAHFYA